MNVSALNPHIDASAIAPERLAKNPNLTEQQKIAEASRQFESILLKQILDSAQKTVIKSKLSDDSTASSIYKDMVTTRLSDSISKSGAFGLSKTFEQQLSRPHGPRPDGLPQKLSTGIHSTAHTLKPLHGPKKELTSATATRPSTPVRGGLGEGIGGSAVKALPAHKFVSK